MHIGILEDDALLAGHVAQLVGSAGHDAALFPTADAFFTGLTSQTFDLLVFDWNLPDQDGLTVLKQLRTAWNNPTPVMFLTALFDEAAVVSALEAGAEDYCYKPLRPAEFQARVAALQRRLYPSRKGGDFVDRHGYHFDGVHRRVSWDDGSAQFSGKEFELARFLFEHSDLPLSRERLMQEVWGRGDDAFSRTLDVHISRVRSRLGLNDTSAVRLRSIHGYGYELVSHGTH